MKRLGVNIDHVATLRQARGTRYPDPIAAAAIAESGGADQITVHPREDRRHIQPHDVVLLRKTVTTLLNMEMACTNEMLELAYELRPDTVTFVPEKRRELTTEGGLDVIKNRKALAKAISRLKEKSIVISLFVEPDPRQIEFSRELGADTVELHTGSYCEAENPDEARSNLVRLQSAAQLAKSANLQVVAGHGLNYENLRNVVQALPEVEEYNIGHSIVARAVFVGLEQAVREMKKLLSYTPEGKI